jgi:hypothetical protein
VGSVVLGEPQDVGLMWLFSSTEFLTDSSGLTSVTTLRVQGFEGVDDPLWLKVVCKYLSEDSH